MAARAVVGRGDDVPGLAPRGEDARDGVRRRAPGPSARTTTAASTSSPSAASPQRSDAPGPRAQSRTDDVEAKVTL